MTARAAGLSTTPPAADGFDPAAAMFTAQRARPPELAVLDPRTLSPFQRALLVIDGTVTQFIEAWALEPVEVRRLAQTETKLADADPWLDLPAGAPAIRRRVLLIGASSGRCFVWADSVIAAGRIPAALRTGLESGPGGLGRILVESGAETRREGLWYGRERRADAPRELGGAEEFLTRTYRVFANRQPLMLITERFPL